MCTFLIFSYLKLPLVMFLSPIRKPLILLQQGLNYVTGPSRSKYIFLLWYYLWLANHDILTLSLTNLTPPPKPNQPSQGWQRVLARLSVCNRILFAQYLKTLWTDFISGQGWCWGNAGLTPPFNQQTQQYCLGLQRRGVGVVFKRVLTEHRGEALLLVAGGAAAAGRGALRLPPELQLQDEGGSEAGSWSVCVGLVAAGGPADGVPGESAWSRQNRTQHWWQATIKKL